MNTRALTNGLLLAAVALATCLVGGRAAGQDSSLLRSPQGSGAGLTQKTSSIFYRELPPEALPRQLALHDIITVVVDYNAVMLSEGDAESRKTASLTAALTDWIRFDGKSIRPDPQSDGDPTIAGKLNSQYRAEADIELRDSLRFRIAAEIVEIYPNGNLVIEAHQSITVNEERWQISLSGIVRRESIQADRTVDSGSIAHLQISKGEEGQVHDGYARGWLKQIMDYAHAF